MGVILPPEYQQVEYLESTGTQSINLDVYANQDSIMICDVLFVKNNQTFYYGGGIAYRSETFECYFWNQNLQFNEGSSTIYLSGSNVPNNIRATIYHSLNRYALTYAGGDVSREETFTSTFQTEYPVHLFALNRQSGVAYGKARIYGAEFYQGQTIVRKCIPCYRKSDDKPGMYDLVSETFLTNAGTGEFLVGPDIIDSISPWMVARRRMLIGDQNKLILYANGNEHTAITGGWDLIRNNNATLTKTASGMTLYANNSQVVSAIGMASFNPALLAKYKKVCVRVSAFLKLVTAGDTYLQIRSEPVWNATVLASTPIKNAGVIELDISAISNGYVIIPFYRVEYTISKIWLEK